MSTQNQENPAKGIVITRDNLESLGKQVHPGMGYTYDMSTYGKNSDKMTICCPIHGDFPQSPKKHIHNANKCPKCASNRKKTHEEFCAEIAETHPNIEVINKYVSANEPILVKCKVHNYEFSPRPSNMTDTDKQSSCIHCYHNTIGINTEKFVKKSNKKYSGLYTCIPGITICNSYDDYVIVSCQFHGLFVKKARNYLYRSGCNQCGFQKIGDSKRLTKEEFVSKSNIKFIKKCGENHHDYSEVEYKTNHDKVKIKCTLHDQIFWQDPRHHMNGSFGCIVCNESKCYSQVACEWMHYFRKYTDVKDALNGGELKITLDKPYKYWNNHILIDGYSEKYNLCLEFDSAAFHSCDTPGCCSFYEGFSEICNMTYEELRTKTITKHKLIRSLGYNLITITSCVYERLRKNGSIEDYIKDIMEDIILNSKSTLDIARERLVIKYIESKIYDNIDAEDISYGYQSLDEIKDELIKYDIRIDDLIHNTNNTFVLRTKKNIDEFAQKGAEIHKDEDGEPLYGYELVHETYGRSNIKVKIHCRRCDRIFEQIPYNHLHDRGCFHCNTKSTHTTESRLLQFANKFKGRDYSYPGFSYSGNNKDKITVVCNTHKMMFNPTVNNHARGSGCPTCGDITRAFKKRRCTEIEKTIDIMNKIQIEKKRLVYIYDLLSELGPMKETEFKFICPEHGIMTHTLHQHITRKSGCEQCSRNRGNTNIKQNNVVLFEKRSNSIYLDKPQPGVTLSKDNNQLCNYDQVIFKDIDTPVIIKCEFHNHTFEETPLNHMRGITCIYCMNSDAMYHNAQKWLQTFNDNIESNTTVILGGYSKNTDTYYEYITCFLNGCDNPECEYTQGINPFLKKSYEELHKQTIDRHNCIKKTGSKLITIRTCQI